MSRSTNKPTPLRIHVIQPDEPAWSVSDQQSSSTNISVTTRGEGKKFAMNHLRDIDRFEVDGEKKWQEGMATFCKPFLKATVKYFDQHRRN